MKCPICGKGMLRGMVISSGSMPFSTNVIFKSERNDVSLSGFLAATFIRNLKLEPSDPSIIRRKCFHLQNVTKMVFFSYKWRMV